MKKPKKTKKTKKSALASMPTGDLFARIRAYGEAQASLDASCSVLATYSAGSVLDPAEDAQAEKLCAALDRLFGQVYEKYDLAISEAERRAGLVRATFRPAAGTKGKKI